MLNENSVKAEIVIAMKVALTAAVFALAACSSSDNGSADDNSMRDDDLPQSENTGDSGGNTSAIAGLWDGSTVDDNTRDIVYWALAEDGVLTRYDYQQDGLTTATGENCYLQADAITVTPKGDEQYSIDDVAVSMSMRDDILILTFNEADKNDLDENGDAAEVPTLIWAAVNTPSIDDLNRCASGNQNQNDEAGEPLEESDPLPEPVVNPESEEQEQTTDPDTIVDDQIVDQEVTPEFMEPDPPAVVGDTTTAIRPSITSAECKTRGGTQIGSPGDGWIHSPQYRCESGRVPIGRISNPESTIIDIEGSVCCL